LIPLSLGSLLFALMDERYGEWRVEEAQQPSFYDIVDDIVE
jgi:hypothetical protein